MYHLRFTKKRGFSSPITFTLALACVITPLHLSAHETPSTYDVVASIRERLSNTFPLEELNHLTVEQIATTLSDDERDVLGSSHIRFEVNVPVRVYVLVDRKFTEKTPIDPFWLEDRGFAKTDYTARCGTDKYIAYSKEFDAGIIGLGVNSLSGDNHHYIVALEALTINDTVELLNIYPAYQTVGLMEVGEDAFTDTEPDPITTLSPELKGLTLLRVDPWRHRDARLTSIYAETKYPSTEMPDQVMLTWSDDPKTTQTIQWRTSAEVDTGIVAYKEQAATSIADTVVMADTRELYTPRVINDQRINRHTVTLTGLKPATSYSYTVKNSEDSTDSVSGTFTTAPDTAQPFSFIYMGDPQVGFDKWNVIVQRAEQERPNAAFCIIAGDLVNRGADRDDWDDLFYNAGSYFTRRPIAPVIGNHEYHLSNGTLLYNDIFKLLKNGPDTVPPQHAYSFEYSNALFVILDSNKPPRDQTAWLDDKLGTSDALWKFVSFHHPIYSSSPRRDNPIHRAQWMPIFDKHHVDMVLQGHDHAYLRTWPMKNNEHVDSSAEGTVYVVSVSGTKMYDMGSFDYAAKAFADTSTYQSLDIQIDGNRLIYKAHNMDGACVDEIIIEK